MNKTDVTFFDKILIIYLLSMVAFAFLNDYLELIDGQLMRVINYCSAPITLYIAYKFLFKKDKDNER